VLLPILFVVGAVLGSLLNTCIDRIPRHERFIDQLRNVVRRPWIDPSSGHPERRTPENAQLAGWFLPGLRNLLGANQCSPRYALVELLNGTLFALLYWYEIPGGANASVSASPYFESMRAADGLFPAGSESLLLHVRYAYHMLLIQALIVATFIDFQLKIIPDSSTLPAMAVGVLLAGAVGSLYLVPLWSQDSGIMFTMRGLVPECLHPLFPSTRVPTWISTYPHWHGLLASLAGLVVGGGIVWSVRLIGDWVLREEAMGFGDVILMAMIGSFLGWQPTIIVFFLAPVMALAVVVISWLARRQREIPYGPYLSLAALVVLLGWPHIWPSAERVFDMGALLPLFVLLAGVMLAACLMFLQVVKRIFGIGGPREEWIEEWTPADQLLHYAGDKIDTEHESGRTVQWPGTSAGRGTLYERHWRNGLDNK
jgi:leader peptidase (prepilin peptidase)/N-methyltransferase